MSDHPRVRTPDPGVETVPHLQETRSERRISKEEKELHRAQRKSNAYLAAEAVQQELDAIKTLKRLSMGGSLTLDPDLPYGVDNEFEDYQKKRQGRRRSSSGSSVSSLEDDAEKTLIEGPSQDSLPNKDEDIKMDAEKLLWVPAKAHPSIAPDKFRLHVQSAIDDMNKKLHTKEKSSDSIPSLKELTDELDKLSEMAGLAATDAVTLARSLSSASSSSSLLYGEAEKAPSSNASPSTKSQDDSDLKESRRLGEDEIDQDAPLLAVENSLKRNKWTTYTRRSRMDKEKARRKHSPLADENIKAIEHSVSKEKQLPSKPHPQRHTQSISQASNLRGIRTQPVQRSVSHGEPPRETHQSQLNRSQSDTGAASKKTNHARNRHAGSLINLNQTPSAQMNTTTPPPTSKETPQRRVSPLTNEFQTKESEVPLRRLPHTPTSPQFYRPETGITKEIPEPPTPIQKPVSKDKDKVKESKSKEFLNMFKMKRSTPSSKNSKDKRVVTPTRTTFDENGSSSPNGSPESYGQQQSQDYPAQKQKTPPLQQQPLHHHQHHQHQSQQQNQIQRSSPQRPSLKPSSFKLIKQKDDRTRSREHRGLQESVNVVPKSAVTASSQIPPQPQRESTSSPTSPIQSSGMATTEEQHRQQRESLVRKLSKENISKSTKPNAPVQFTDSAFGFPLPPLSQSTIIMLDYRFPIHVERALYRLSHLKLANPRRPLRQQVLLSNFMYAYLNLVNHTLYLQQLDEEINEDIETAG